MRVEKEIPDTKPSVKGGLSVPRKSKRLPRRCFDTDHRWVLFFFFPLSLFTEQSSGPSGPCLFVAASRSVLLQPAAHGTHRVYARHEKGSIYSPLPPLLRTGLICSGEVVSFQAPCVFC